MPPPDDCSHAEAAEAAVLAAEAELELQLHNQEDPGAAAAQVDGSIAGAGPAPAGGEGTARSLSFGPSSRLGPVSLLCCCCARVFLAAVPEHVAQRAARRLGGAGATSRQIPRRGSNGLGLGSSRRSSMGSGLAFGARMHAAWRRALERIAVFSLTAIGFTGRAARSLNIRSNQPGHSRADNLMASQYTSRHMFARASRRASAAAPEASNGEDTLELGADPPERGSLRGSEPDRGARARSSAGASAGAPGPTAVP